MTEHGARSRIKQILLHHAPDLSTKGFDMLLNMHSSEYLHGTEEDDPILIQPSVKIPIREGAQLRRIILDNDVKRSMEIGFAYGFSTVWMLDGLSAHPNASHTSVDPFEKSDWQGIGLHQVKELDANVRFEWIEDYAIHAISRFIKAEERFDFIFIDGNHRFDDIIVDFYLSDMVLSPGGIIAFDDMWMKSIRAAVGFVTNNRQYELVRQPVDNLAVFRKVADDSRPWNHYRSFRTAERFHEMITRIARSKRLRNKMVEVIRPASR